jgi:hypothetical protein
MRGRCLWSAAAAVVAFALFPGAASAGVASQTFSFTGAEQVFSVPSGVSAVTVVAAGGPGAAAGRSQYGCHGMAAYSWAAGTGGLPSRFC